MFLINTKVFCFFVSFEKRPSAVITTAKGQQVLIKKHKIVAGAVAANHHAAIDTKQQRISVRPLFVICVNTRTAR